MEVGGGCGAREQPVSPAWGGNTRQGTGHRGLFCALEPGSGLSLSYAGVRLRQVTQTLCLSFPFLKQGCWIAVGDEPSVSDWEVSGLRAPLKSGATQSGRGAAKKIGSWGPRCLFHEKKCSSITATQSQASAPRGSLAAITTCVGFCICSPGSPTLPAPPGPARGLHCKLPTRLPPREHAVLAGGSQCSLSRCRSPSSGPDANLSFL